MNAPESSVPLANEHFPEGTVDAGVYTTHEEGFQHSLVVLAMGKDCWLITDGDGHHLRVATSDLPAVLGQLACFDHERLSWPPRPLIDAIPILRHLPLSPLVWVLLVCAVFGVQQERHELTDTGMVDVQRMFAHGEWWRVGSALWLHNDIGHLVSNAGSGLLVFSAVVSTLGFRKGWTLLAASAVAGNLIAATIRFGSDYRSLGASTAIFAGLGLLTGRAVRVMSRSDHPHRWRAMIVPLLAGIAVLCLFGAGGANIDLLAHATGFGAGCVLGFLAAGSSPDRQGNVVRSENQ
jgi:rhomboid protease GluP